MLRMHGEPFLPLEPCERNIKQNYSPVIGGLSSPAAYFPITPPHLLLTKGTDSHHYNKLIMNY